MNLDQRLLALARKPWLALCLTIVCGVLAGWLTIAQARGFSLVVADVFLGGKDLEEVRNTLLIMAGFIAVRALLAGLMEISASAVAERVKVDLREILLTRIETLGPAYTRGERAGELAATVIDGVQALEAYFSQYLPQLVISSLVPLSILIFVFPLDPLSGVVLLLTAPLIPLFMILIGKGAEKITRRQFETLGRLSAHFLESLQGLTTLKQLGRSRDQVQSVRENSEKYRDVTLAVLRITFLSALALELIATMSTAIVAVEVGLRLLNGGLPFDKALFLLVLAPEFYIPLRMLGLRFHAGMAGTSAARRIFAILDIRDEQQDFGPGVSDPSQAESEHDQQIQAPIHNLVFDSVTYTYPGESASVLKDISWEIHQGQHIAFVGPSGGGKSTLVSLLLGFINPQGGTIKINGVSLKSISKQAWRTNVGWVPQNPHLFHDTIAANLRIARANATDEEMESAARAAFLDTFIHTLPAGYETIIGEEGVRLSGGQAQRLALARAFLKDAPILVLDEPTSSVDPKTEQVLQDSTRRLMKDRMVITIAHRLNTVAAADCIIVIQEGSIVEKGSHTELLAGNGVYRKLVEAMHIQVRPANGLSVLEHEPEITVQSTVPAVNREDVPESPIKNPVCKLLAFIQGSWGGVGLSVLLGGLTIGASMGLMATSSWLIATAALHPSIAELSLAIVGVRFFGILRGIARYLERLTSHRVTFNLLARLRTWFYEKLEPLSPRHLGGYRNADILERIVNHVEMLENFYGRVISPALVAWFLTVFTAFILGKYNPLLAWTGIVFSLVLGVFLPALTTRLGRNPGTEIIRLRSDLKIKVIDTIQGLADLLSFGKSTQYLAAINEDATKLARAQGKMARVTGFSSAGGVLFSQLGMLSILVLSIPLVRAGQLAGVLLPVLALLTLASFEATQPLAQAFQYFYACKTAAGKLFEIVEGKQEKTSQAAHFSHMQESGDKYSVRISGLTFTYPGSVRPALLNFDLELPEGKKIAIVGPSGAGKSTLFQLLLRFWEAPTRTIHLAGHDLLDFPADDVRSYFNVISQRTFLFHATIRENLLLGKPGAADLEIEKAVRAAGLHDFIQRLPLGYDTVVGERGMRLSGGERQRLAIARVLLKNAPIFLLDEPTANLDPLMAKTIMENILQLAQDRSILLITHRLAGLDTMDEIIFLEEGKTRERGRHCDLILGGAYRQMVAIQMQILPETG